jgi:hypothetical protein
LLDEQLEDHEMRLTRPRSARRPLAAAGLATLALAACGGSSHPASEQPAAQIKQVVQSYLSAQASGDGQAACALLTAGGQAKLENLIVTASNGLVKTRPSCADAVSLVSTVAGPTVMKALNDARIESIQVHGNQATAKVVDGGAFPAQQVTLDKSGETWQISGIPTLGQ